MVITMMRYFPGQTREYWHENLDMFFYRKVQDWLLRNPPASVLLAAVYKYKAPKRKSEIKSMKPLLGQDEYEP